MSGNNPTYLDRYKHIRLHLSLTINLSLHNVCGFSCWTIDCVALEKHQSPKLCLNRYKHIRLHLSLTINLSLHNVCGFSCWTIDCVALEKHQSPKLCLTNGRA